MKRILITIIAVFAVVSLITISLTINQITQEQTRMENDLKYRSSLLTDGLRESVEPNFINQSNEYLQGLVEKFSHRQRIAGIAVVDNTGQVIAGSSSLPKGISEKQKIVSDVMDADKPDGHFVNFNNTNMYVYASPLHDDKKVVGALVVVNNATYINDRLYEIWTSTVLRVFIQTLLYTVAILLLLRWVLYAPIQQLVKSLKHIRLNKDIATSPLITKNPFFSPIIKEVSQMQQSLMQARLAASEEARVSLEKLDTPWTSERLRQFTKDILDGRTIIAVSNLEPYIHSKNGNSTTYHVPASGLITAIEPVMQACGGMWVAQGSGNADQLTVDNNDHIQVPPEDPKYTLRRVWLTEEEIQRYYNGFADQAMYPLCHMAHIRPVFNDKDWEEYKKVNAKFAQAILTEIKEMSKPLIFIQDFHFTLLPKLIKEKRPDATIGIFWHIPWVSAESFSICPWKKEIVDGMLGADLIGFHTQQHCNNFIETASRELECLIDYEQFTVTRNSHISLIKPFPISISFSGSDEIQIESERNKPEAQELLKQLGIKSKYIGFGVDRLDYIKGIQDRIIGIEIFFEMYPEYIEQFTFIQVSSPSESKSKKYLEFTQSVEETVERINNRFKTKTWKPIILLAKHHNHKQINQYYKIADFCLVSSLHDGMNLVAKEFVASRNDEKGVLILSQFAGAIKELKEAIMINPYNGKETAQAIHTALQMSPQEQTKRMKKMRNSVKNYNIYRWSAEFLKTMVSLG